MQPLIARAYTLVELQRPEEALDILHSAPSEYAEDADYLCTLAFACSKLELWLDVEANARKAITANPNYEWGYRLLAISLNSQGKEQEALKSLQRGREHAPHSPQILYNLGNIYLQMQKLSAAEETAKHLCVIASDWEEAHLFCASCLMKQRDWTQAESEARTALRINPESTKAHQLLGLVLTKQRDFPEAIKSLERAVLLDPESTEAKQQLAHTLDRYGWFTFPIGGTIGYVIAGIADMGTAGTVFTIGVMILFSVIIQKQRLEMLSPEMQQLTLSGHLHHNANSPWQHARKHHGWKIYLTVIGLCYISAILITILAKAVEDVLLGILIYAVSVVGIGLIILFVRRKLVR